MDASERDAAVAGRLLAATVGGRADLEGSVVERSVALLGSDEKRARVTAAWTLGLAADEAPAAVLPAIPAIAAHLEDEATRSDAERALAYLGRSSPGDVEAAVEAVDDEDLQRRCREAIWGVGAPRTVVSLSEEEPEPDPDPQVVGEGSVNDPYWGWAGGSSTAYEPTGSDERRRGPPDRTPVEPPAVDRPHGDYEPVATLHDGDVVTVLKALYPDGSGGSAAATLLQFHVEPTDAFREAFEYRTALWDSLSSHDHVLPVVDWGTEPGAWLAVEHAVGRGVAGLADDLGVDGAGWVLSRVADALCHAHERGVTHGGLTPAAVVRSDLVVEPGTWPFPRVTDWGLAALLAEYGPDRTLPTRHAAPEHLAPEEFGDVDDATDVFGFGVTAYEALVGRSPFTDREVPVREAVLEGDWRPASEVNPALPSGVDDVLAKCLAARKTERYETAQATRSEFRAAVGDTR